MDKDIALPNQSSTATLLRSDSLVSPLHDWTAVQYCWVQYWTLLEIVNIMRNEDGTTLVHVRKALWKLMQCPYTRKPGFYKAALS